MKRLKAVILLVALILAGPAYAQEESASGLYEFDKAHTQILFFVDHLGFSTSQGEFLSYDGHFQFNQEEPESSAVEVTIQTESIDMDDEAWDKHLKNEDFFDVEKFPTMTFKSTAIEVTGENTARMTGDLTLLGVTKPVTLEVTHNKSGPRHGKYVSGFSARGTLNRSEFGMGYGLPAVGDEVKIWIEVEGYRQDGNEGPSDDPNDHSNHDH